jgi:hypothetical protein
VDIPETETFVYALELAGLVMASEQWMMRHDLERACQC